MIVTCLPRTFRLATLLALASLTAWSQTWAPMRPPAVPLIAHDPYFSIWSTANHLNGAPTTHWTGKPNTLTALARIDGTVYQIMGRERGGVEFLKQDALQVLPTRTIYEFSGVGVTI